MFSDTVIKAAQDHARAEFPKESCGFVVQDGNDPAEYVPLQNIHADPEHFFEAPPSAWAKLGPFVRAVLHSHPFGPLYPSKADMEGQIQTDVPWGIIALDEERIGPPIMWGDEVPMMPLIGRQFMHGIHDCYAIIRDSFRLGREEMAKQGMEWPFEPIVLPEVPRDDNWWAGDDDLYTAHFEKFGFHKIHMSEARAGDVFLMKIRSNKLNHGGVLLGGGLIAHHLAGARLSRREPAGLWGRAADLWIRHEAADA